MMMKGKVPTGSACGRTLGPRHWGNKHDRLHSLAALALLQCRLVRGHNLDRVGGRTDSAAAASNGRTLGAVLDSLLPVVAAPHRRVDASGKRSRASAAGAGDHRVQASVI